MLITLFLLIMAVAIASFVWAERNWYKARWWMLEPYAGLKFISSWLMLCTAVFCFPLIVTAAVFGWP